MSSKWFVKPKSVAVPKIKLFCFPYAGGAATTYIPWARKLPEYLELVIVQPPGRGSRIMEPAHNSMERLIEDMYPQIVAELTDSPYVFFGHSLGSRVAFELIHKLRENGIPLPQHFIASGSRAPHVPSLSRSMHDLPDQEFITALKNLNGTPVEVLENSELMDLYMPLLRSDFEISDKYRSTHDTPLDIPVSVFGGDDDRHISADDLKDWQHNFSSEIATRNFPGGHFFVESSADAVMEEVVCIVRNTITVRDS